MTRRATLLLLATSLALPVAASPEDGPALRPLAQAATKGALGETRLPDEAVGEMYAEVQAFTRSWGRHVLDVGARAAAKEDLRAVVDAALRDALQAKGVALTQQEAIIDAMRLRAEATLRDLELLAEAQGQVKRALASSLEEPLPSEALERIKGWADDSHVFAAAPSVGGGERVPAIELVRADVGPYLAEIELDADEQADVLKPLARWLELRATVEGDAGE